MPLINHHMSPKPMWVGSLGLSPISQHNVIFSPWQHHDVTPEKVRVGLVLLYIPKRRCKLLISLIYKRSCQRVPLINYHMGPKPMWVGSLGLSPISQHDVIFPPWQHHDVTPKKVRVGLVLLNIPKRRCKLLISLIYKGSC